MRLIGVACPKSRSDQFSGLVSALSREQVGGEGLKQKALPRIEEVSKHGIINIIVIRRVGDDRVEVAVRKRQLLGMPFLDVDGSGQAGNSLRPFDDPVELCPKVGRAV